MYIEFSNFKLFFKILLDVYISYDYIFTYKFNDEHEEYISNFIRNINVSKKHKSNYMFRQLINYYNIKYIIDKDSKKERKNIRGNILYNDDDIKYTLSSIIEFVKDRFKNKKIPYYDIIEKIPYIFVINNILNNSKLDNFNTLSNLRRFLDKLNYTFKFYKHNSEEKNNVIYNILNKPENYIEIPTEETLLTYKQFKNIISYKNIKYNLNDYGLIFIEHLLFYKSVYDICENNNNYKYFIKSHIIPFKDILLLLFYEFCKNSKYYEFIYDFKNFIRNNIDNLSFIDTRNNIQSFEFEVDEGDTREYNEILFDYIYYFINSIKNINKFIYFNLLLENDKNYNLKQCKKHYEHSKSNKNYIIKLEENNICNNNCYRHFKFTTIFKHMYISTQSIIDIEKNLGKEIIKRHMEYFDVFPNKYTINSQYNLHEEQQSIYQCNSTLNFIYGSAGCGKTYSICHALLDNGDSDTGLIISSPTGRATSNFCETLYNVYLQKKDNSYNNNITTVENFKNNLISGTIHKLYFEIKNAIYNYNKYDTDNNDIKNKYYSNKTIYFIVDEISMINYMTLKKLFIIIRHLEKIGNKIIIFFIGDYRQLPCIGLGNIVYDIYNSKYIKTELLINHRAKNNPDIQLLNKCIDEEKNIPTEFITYNDTNNSFEECIKKHSVDDDIFNTQFITYTNVRTDEINKIIQEKNKSPLLLDYNKHNYNKTFKLNDKVISTINNYTYEYFNGEIYYIENINNDYITIRFDDRNTKDIPICIFHEDFKLAYSITCHKSQGMSIDNVVYIIDSNQCFNPNGYGKKHMYTAVTRSKYNCKIISLINRPIEDIYKSDYKKITWLFSYDIDTDL